MAGFPSFHTSPNYQPSNNEQQKAASSPGSTYGFYQLFENCVVGGSDELKAEDLKFNYFKKNFDPCRFVAWSDCNLRDLTYYNFANDIDTYGFTNQSYLFEMAKFVAENAPSVISECIGKFGLTDPIQRYEIAKIVSASQPIFKHVRNFEISDQNQLYDVLRQTPQRHFRQIYQNIQAIGLTDQELLFKLAQLCAEFDPKNMTIHVQNFGLSDPLHRLEIAKTIANHPLSVTDLLIENLQNFNLTAPDHALEIAHTLVKKSPQNLSSILQKLNFTDQTHIFGLTFTAAAQENSKLSTFIHTLGISDKNQLFEIAKIAAAQKGSNICQYIQNYGLEDQNQLFEIAKIAAEHHPDDFLEYLHNFDLTIQDQLTEIALINAVKSTSENSLFELGQLQKRFPNLDKNRLFAIAKNMLVNDNSDPKWWGAKHHPNPLRTLIHNFKFTGNQIVELVKVIAQKNAFYLASNIHHYIDFLPQDDTFFEIAKIAANYDAFNVSMNIGYYYGYLDENQRCEIAKIAAKQDAIGLSYRIADYGIEDENRRFEIAKIVAGQNMEALAPYLDNYELTQQNQFIQILMVAISGGASLKHIKKLLDQIECCSLFLDKDRLNFGISEEISLKTLDSFPKGLNDIISSINQEKDHHVRENKTLWLMPILIYYFTNDAFGSDYLQLHNLFIALKNERNPDLSKKMTQELLEMLYNEDISMEQKRALFNSLVKIKSTTKKAVEGRDSDRTVIRENAEGVISTITTCLHVVRGKNVYQTTQKTPISGYKRITALLIQKIFGFADSREIDRLVNLLCCNDKDKINFLKFLYGLLHSLVHETNLQKDEKRFLLEKIGSIGDESKDPVMVERLMNLITTIIKLGYAEKIKPSKLQLTSSASTSSQEVMFLQKLEQILGEILIEAFDLGGDEDWLGKYFETFYKFRDPYAIFTYMGSINRLHELEQKEMKNAFKAFVLSVFNGSYPTEIFDTAQNPHLQKVFSECEEIKEKWMHDAKSPVSGTNNLIVVDTIGVEDKLLSSNEVFGSCQNLDGSPIRNKGFIGYLMHGQNRLVALKDSDTGRILARCLLRLLWDETNNVPALYQEHIYFGNVSDKNRAQELLEDMCRRRAENIGCALYSKSGKHPALASYGGPAPFEYVDAGQLTITNKGVFTIPSLVY